MYRVRILKSEITCALFAELPAAVLSETGTLDVALVRPLRANKPLLH